MDSSDFYTALFGLLEGLYELSKSDDVASLLGDMSLLPDGTSADTEVLIRWQSYGAISSEGVAYKCAIKFLDREVELTRSSHLAFVANTMRHDYGRDPNESLLRKAWLYQVERARNGFVPVAMLLTKE